MQRHEKTKGPVRLLTTGVMATDEDPLLDPRHAVGRFGRLGGIPWPIRDTDFSSGRGSGITETTPLRPATSWHTIWRGTGHPTAGRPR